MSLINRTTAGTIVVTSSENNAVQSFCAMPYTICSTVPSGSDKPKRASPAKRMFPSAIHVNVLLKSPPNVNAPFFHAFQIGKPMEATTTPTIAKKPPVLSSVVISPAIAPGSAGNDTPEAAKMVRAETITV